MVDVVTEITINCPIEQVSSYASDPENAPTWYVNIHSAEWKTAKPLKIGSKIAFKAKFIGRELAYVYEIVEVLPEKKLAMKTANGPFPMETIYTWFSLDHNQTRMILRNKGNPTGFSKIITPLISKMMKKANMKDLQKLKYILENPS
ncbi:SRPBCC family protein [Fictibacillus enclensis]|uniref:SRPBCC family protein n=1 Tax=Fictibacillus enclensis TaxID=1017270 RepID=UPI0025A14851|nr:SRPBCC family protein [Fictibacillus enclensis]MDM5197248.1 SRPBCC family protein [Fictibacillus enclensis]